MLKTKQQPPSQLRQDIVSGNWVAIASGRAKRPKSYKTKYAVVNESKKDCPFCNLETNPHKVMLVHSFPKDDPYLKEIKKEGSPLPTYKKEPFSIIDVYNKFPTFAPVGDFKEKIVGPYKTLPGYGFHEVIIPASHYKTYGELPIDQVKEIIDVFQARYLNLAPKKHIDYISIIHNHRPEAGASIFHPHSQLFAIPIIPKDIKASINGSKKYFEKYGKCPHCEMIEWERNQKKRIIFENKDFIVVCPFTSEVAFETRIYPKLHFPYFERIEENEKINFAKALKIALHKIYKALDDPPFNFFIHTAPADEKDHSHYHWHLEIFPKVTIWAGFELGTGIEISTVEPKQAAEILRKTK